MLEFGTLAPPDKKEVFSDKPKKALVELFSRRAKTGLVGEEIDVVTGEWKSPTTHVGGGIDSYYEYLRQVRAALRRHRVRRHVRARACAP